MVTPYRAAAANNASDSEQAGTIVENHWAKEVLNKWIMLGLLQGDQDQNYRPDQPITRAEFAALIDRVFNLPEALASTNPFADVSNEAWYAKDIIKLYSAGMIKGTSADQFEPNKPIARQDAAVIVARAFQVKAVENQTNGSFSDASSISSYALAEVMALKAKGYVKGNGNNQFKPKQSTTRAEVVQMIDNVMGTLVMTKSVYESDVEGNLVVNTDGSSLKNIVVSGDLYITQGVEEGEVLLDGVTVKGSTYVLGGGKNSVIVRDSNLTGTLIVDKWDSQIRIVAEGTTVVHDVQMRSGGILKEENLQGIGFVKVSIDVPSGQTNPLIVLDGEFDEVDHRAGTASYELTKAAKVLLMIFNAPASVTGDGVIQTATLNVGGVKMNKWPIKINFSTGITVTIGNEVFSADHRNTTSNSGGTGTQPTPTPSSEPTTSPTPTPSSEPTTSPTPTPSSGPALTIAESGAAKADIFVDASAQDMIGLAAKELQDTIKMVSGAVLPIYRWNSEATVSAVLSVDELKINRAGQYPVQIHLVNNEDASSIVHFQSDNDDSITVDLPEQVELGSHEKKVINGSVKISAALLSGEYKIDVQASVSGTPLNPMTLTIQYEPNLIMNPGFEIANGSVPDGWFSPSGIRLAGESYSGDYAMRLDLGSSEYMFAQSTQNLKLEPGKQYKLSAMVKGSAAGVMNMEIHEVTNGGSPVIHRTELALSDQWKPVELVYSPAANATFDYNSIYFFMSGTASMWIDDVSLVEIVKASPNLITNNGFEAPNLAGWWGFSGYVFDDGEVSHSGEHSMRIELKGESYMYAQQDLNLQPGKRYKLRAWVKAASAGKLSMTIHEIQSGGGSNAAANVDATVGADEAWQLVEMEYAPAKETQFDSNRLYIFVSETNAVWVDDVSLTEMNEVVGQDGSGETNGETSDNGVRFLLATPDSHPGLTALFPEDIAYLQQSDGFAVRQVGNLIYIIGTEPKGVLNGVYDFIEKNAGVLWTRSQELGTLYDPQPTIQALHVNYREKSPFQIRGWHLTGSGAQGQFHSDPASEVMISRNKLNAKLAEFGNVSLWDDHERVGIKAFNIGHDLVYWLPSEEYFATHPEYFNTDGAGNYIPGTGETQINFYNPEVADVIAGRVKAFLKNNPREYVGMGINDTHYWMQGDLSNSPFELPDGTKIYPNEADYKSTVFYSFLNRIAAEVKKTYPDVKINTFAYFFAEVPPRIELEDNIVIVLAPASGDDRVPINTSEVSANNQYVVKLQGWLKKTKNIVMYNYYGSFPSATYERPIAEKVQADMKYYRDLGLMGVLPENIVDASTASWGVNALQFWLMQKLFWNPDADLEALKSEFIQKAYGAAAEPMKRYYDLIAQGWNYDQQPVSYITNTKAYIRSYIIDAGIKDEAQQALNEAWSLADQKARQRIEPIKTTFETMVFKYGEQSDLSAKATKTTASKEEIVSGLDFSQGPWADAEPTSQFFYMGTTDKAPVETKVRLLWDEENLYVAYENFDDDVSKIVASDNAPGDWWASGGDDDVETYVTGDLTGGAYYVFFANPKAVKFEYSGPAQNSAFSTQWEVHTEVASDRWKAIKVIPFASINVDPNVSKTLKGFFFREYHGKEGFFGWGGGSVWSWADFKTITLED
nr:DUF4838 domain-containing protein [Cohnella hashimotonis]